MIDKPSDYGLKIKNTPNMGKGLFADRDIKKGEYIAPFLFTKSNIMSIPDFHKKYGKDYRFTYRDMRHHRIIVVKNNRNVATYINENKRNPNVELRAFKLYALKPIKKGSQLFLKYWYNTDFK